MHKALVFLYVYNSTLWRNLYFLHTIYLIIFFKSLSVFTAILKLLFFYKEISHLDFYLMI